MEQMDSWRRNHAAKYANMVIGDGSYEPPRPTAIRDVPFYTDKTGEIVKYLNRNFSRKLFDDEDMSQLINKFINLGLDEGKYRSSLAKGENLMRAIIDGRDEYPTSSITNLAYQSLNALSLLGKGDVDGGINLWDGSVLKVCHQRGRTAAVTSHTVTSKICRLKSFAIGE